MSRRWCFPVAECVYFKVALAVGMVVTLLGGQLHARCIATDTVVVSGASASSGQPLKIIAFGTSLMWENGLKDKRTFRIAVCA